MKDLTQGNIYKTFFLFGLPIVLSGLLAQTYSTIDTAIAGHYLGEQGLAAIGSTAPLVTFVSAIFWGYLTGFSIYTTRLFGEGNYHKIKSAVTSTRIFSFIFSIILALLLILFHNQLFDLLNVEKSLRSDAFAYFSIYISGIFFITLTHSNATILNGFGISSFPLYVSILSAILNVSGNIFTIIVLDLGVAGLALASVFAAVVTNSIYAVKYHKCLKELGVDKEKSHVGFIYIKNSLPYAVPSMLQQMVMYLASLFISPLVNGIGKEASASYSVVSRIYDINASVYQNSTRAFTTYTAQCAGRKEYGKIPRGVRVGLLQSSLFVTPFVLTCVIFPNQVCSLFFKADAGIVAREYAFVFARFVIPFVYFNVINNLMHGLFRATKSTRFLFSSSCFGAIIRYVFSVLLIPTYGMNGFYVGWIISWILECVFDFILYFTGKWNPERQKPIKTN